MTGSLLVFDDSLTSVSMLGIQLETKLNSYDHDSSFLNVLGSTVPTPEPTPLKGFKNGWSDLSQDFIIQSALCLISL